jgi:hypothetical protein
MVKHRYCRQRHSQQVLQQLLQPQLLSQPVLQQLSQHGLQQRLNSIGMRMVKHRYCRHRHSQQVVQRGGQQLVQHSPQPPPWQPAGAVATTGSAPASQAVEINKKAAFTTNPP